jgi:ATP-dependent Lon protease
MPDRVLWLLSFLSASALSGAVAPPKEIPAMSELSILPLRGAVLFPGGNIPLEVGRPSTIALIRDALRSGRDIGVVALRRPDVEGPTEADFHSIGVTARIVKFVELPEHDYALVLMGLTSSG